VLQTTELLSSGTSQNEQVKITVKLAEELCLEDPTSVTIFTAILKEVLAHSGLKQVNMNFFQPAKAVILWQHR